MEKKTAYAILEVKSFDEESRTLEGIATTPSVDRMGDIVEPEGAQFSLPLPLLWQHDSRQPVGHVTHAKVSKDGITVKMKIERTDEPGRLKERLDEAWQSVKMKLVRGLSIGFVSKEHAQIDGTWGMRFIKWDWLELSLVTIPANSDASIEAIKSADRKYLRAASGTAKQVPIVRLESSQFKAPGVSGPKSSISKPSNTSDKGSSEMKPIAQQIAEFEAKRAATASAAAAIMSKAAEEGRSLDETESEEHDNHMAEVRSIDAHLKRLKEHEQLMVSTATPVPAKAGSNPEEAAQLRSTGSAVISVQRNLPKGTSFTRYAIALARSKGNLMQAAHIAKGWKDTPEVERALKAAVDAGTTTDTNWAAPLVEEAQQMASEFIELLRPQTIIGRIANFRRVPFNVKMPRQTSGSSAGWVGQGLPKPVSELAFDTVSLGFAKISGIVVLTEELVRFSSPAAEAVVRQDLIDVISEFSDEQFIDPGVSAVANISPASVTNGVSAVSSSGASVAAVTADVQELMQKFITANIGLQSGVWVMNPRTALALSMLRTSQDVFAFPTITMQGGTFFGLPVITSNNVPVAGTSGNPTIIVLLNANDVLLADDGAVTLDVSREASLQMDNAPATGAQSLVSLWQNNLVGLRAERFINYLKRRSAAVQYISGVTY